MFMAYGITDSIIKNADGKGELLLTKLDNATSNVQRKLNRKAEIIVSVLEPRDTLPKDVEAEKEIVETKSLYKNFKIDSIKKGDRISLNSILFKTNYSYIINKSRKDLKELAAFLKDHPEIIFKIQGHVCCVERGRDGIDLKSGRRNLSEARAKFIYDYLADHGVSKKRMRYMGYGSRFPLGGAPKDDRRVEILVTYIKKIRK